MINVNVGTFNFVCYSIETSHGAIPLSMGLNIL